MSGNVQVNLTSLPPVKVQVTPPAVVGVIVGAGVVLLPGASGGYTHTQAVASTVWTINHNLGFSPNVQARTVGGLVFDAEINHLSLNVCELRMIVPFAGTARLS